MAITIGSLVGLGVTNIGLYADIRSSVNNLQKSMSRTGTLTKEIEEIQLSIDELINNIQHLSVETSNVKESLETFMVLDQLHIKVNELNTEMEQLIQDLVLANAGHVTSTLFPVSTLLNIIQRAKYEWNFQPFFDSNNIALYYPILLSFINDTGVIIEVPLS